MKLTDLTLLIEAKNHEDAFSVPQGYVAASARMQRAGFLEENPTARGYVRLTREGESILTIACSADSVVEELTHVRDRLTKIIEGL